MDCICTAFAVEHLFIRLHIRPIIIMDYSTTTNNSHALSSNCDKWKFSNVETCLNWYGSDFVVGLVSSDMTPNICALNIFPYNYFMCTFSSQRPSHKTYHSFIRVRWLGVYSSIINNILEGRTHKTAIAALVAITGGTVHQILRTEVDQLSCGLHQLTFKSPNRAECPTRTTCTLTEKREMW